MPFVRLTASRIMAAIMTETAAASSVPYRPNFIRRLGGFIWWVLTGFGLFSYLAHRDNADDRFAEITVYSVHRSFFLWAVIFTGFIAAAIVKHHPRSAVFFGWFYVWVLIYTFVSR